MKCIRSLWLATVIASIFLLYSCRSTKQVVDVADGLKKDVEWVSKMRTNALNSGTVTSKMNVELVADGKRISAGGNFNLKKDEIIQLSVSLLGFMEIGRLEFTPDYLMLINRAERQYVKLNYADVPYLQQVGINFHSLQSLFWADLFKFGKSGTWEESDFVVTKSGDKALLQTEQDILLQSRFILNLLTGLLESSTVSVAGNGHQIALNWYYDRFVEVGDRRFPDHMRIEVGDGGKTVTSLSISLSNVKWNSKEVELTKEPGSKYKIVDAKSLLNKLLKI